MTTRPWSPAQAGYQPATAVQASTREDGTGSPVQFIRTRHGAVARVQLDPTYTEVLIWRSRNERPTFQGTVRLSSGGWTGFGPDDEPVTGVHEDYEHAEAPLLLRRTRCRSHTTFPWPTRITRR
jgi:hypothetical protein